MLNFLDVGTAYFIAGLMYFVMPLLVWGSLRHNKHLSIPLWFAGSEFFAFGVLLLAMRTQLPTWASYELGNTLLGAGSLLRIYGLQLLHKNQSHPRLLIALGLAHSVGYILAHNLLPQSHLFFIWSLLCIALELGLVSWYAHRIGHTQKLPSMLWLSFVYIPIIIALVARAIGAIVVAQTPANIVSTHPIGVWIALMGVIAAVVSNTSFLAMFVERSAHERQANIELNAQRNLHTMAAALSHELGQPMTNIQLMTDIWRQSPQTIDAQEVLSQVHSNIGTAIGILERMRNLGKADSIALQKVDLLDIH